MKRLLSCLALLLIMTAGCGEKKKSVIRVKDPYLDAIVGATTEELPYTGQQLVVIYGYYPDLQGKVLPRAVSAATSLQLNPCDRVIAEEKSIFVPITGRFETVFLVSRNPRFQPVGSGHAFHECIPGSWPEDVTKN